MKNCLKTQLKEVVNNDNLQKLGAFMLLIKNQNVTNDLQRRMLIETGTSGDCVITCEGNGGVATSATGTFYTSYTIPANTVLGDLYLFFKNGDYKVYISNKYNITKLSVNAGVGYSVINADLNELKYNENLKTLSFKMCDDVELNLDTLADKSQMVSITFDNIFNKKPHGNLSDLSGLVNLITLDIPYMDDIVGDIAQLGNLTNLTTMNISTMGIYGTVESFVSAQCNAATPRTSATVRSNNLLRFISFGGNTLSDAIYYEWIEWNTVSKIIVYIGTTSISSKEDASIIWAKGATAEEIASWEQAGKTVNVIA